MNPIITKIEKLLRLSADQDGTPEGETAAKLASRMMAAHAIERAQIDLDKDAADDPIEKQEMRVPGSVWRRQLANYVAGHCNCQIAYRARQGRGQVIVMYGHKTDIEVLRYLYAVCERQIEAAASRYVRGLPGYYSRGDRTTMGNEFRRSAVQGLSSKLEEIRQGTEAENAEGFALVLGRARRVGDWVDENANLRAGRAAAGYAHNDSGYAAGLDVSLSAGVGSSGSTGQIGSRRLLGVKK